MPRSAIRGLTQIKYFYPLLCATPREFNELGEFLQINEPYEEHIKI